MLKFFGAGAGFADQHTSACFSCHTTGEMVIIDCPISTFQKVKHLDLSEYNRFSVLITHTHGDHIGGLGLFVQYAFFTLHKPVTIVAPSKAVASDIRTVLTIEGNEPSWYELTTAEEVHGKEWFGESILTEHSPQLKNKCFGYQLFVDGKNVVYTGDTSTLQPFLPYLEDGSELYVDTSVYYGMIHLKLEDALDDFISFTQRNIRVFLMHLDDADAARKIVENIPGIEVINHF